MVHTCTFGERVFLCTSRFVIPFDLISEIDLECEDRNGVRIVVSEQSYFFSGAEAEEIRKFIKKRPCQDSEKSMVSVEVLKSLHEKIAAYSGDLLEEIEENLNTHLS